MITDEEFEAATRRGEEERDVSLWMPDLLAGITGTRAWMAARGLTGPPPEPGH
jgi:hypothetical protein